MRSEIEYPDLCLANDESVDWSIVIPTINDARRVVKCITTCREHLESGLSLEFLVVDDGTRDTGTLRELKRQSVELGFRLFWNDQNLGFSASVNHGMRHARGHYVALCNNDIVFHQPCFGALGRAFQMHRDVGVIGCKLIYPQGTIQHAGMDKVPGQLRWTHTFHGYPADHPAACTSRYVWSVTGAFCAFRRETLQRLGGLSTAYAMAYEDLDYCLRAWTKGVRVYFCADAVAVHEESGTLGRKHVEKKSRPLVWSERERAGRRYFEKKWKALRDAESFEALMPDRAESLCW
jgi:GT2 family glycosyltransferase